VLTLVCHCRDCQKLSASAFSPTVVYRRAEISFEGELATYEGRADSGKRKVACFCPHCGNRIYHVDPEAPETIRLKGGTLDGGPIPEPQVHVWTARKQPWVEIPANLPQFPGNAENLGAVLRARRAKNGAESGR